jgi:N-glycosidase YbiA
MIDSFSGKYRFLSNFYPCEIHYKGIIYPSVEHFYVAMKVDNSQVIDDVEYTLEEFRTFISKVNNPGKAKKIGQKLLIRESWNTIRLKVMEYGIKQKFTTNENLKSKLLSTQNLELIEGNEWGDVFWGVSNSKGENNLGKILMKIRNEIRNDE